MLYKCLKTKTYFHCRTLQQLAFKLDGELLSGEEELLNILIDEEDGEAPCLHYLLDTRPGALHPEDPLSVHSVPEVVERPAGGVCPEDKCLLHHGLSVRSRW